MLTVLNYTTLLFITYLMLLTLPFYQDELLSSQIKENKELVI